MMEFHISRSVRERYEFADTLFAFDGNVIFANLAACREFAHRMNQVRGAERASEQRVHPGALFAMGLIDEASHAVVELYRRQYDPAVMTDGLAWLERKFNRAEVDKLLLQFVEQYPGSSVYRGEQTAADWLAGASDGFSHRAAAFEEMILLWMANRNQAFQPFCELFDDASLASETIYREAAQSLPEYFATRPLIPVANAQPMDLYRLLMLPAQSAPGSLRDQLATIRQKWARLLGPALDRFLLTASEILHEEELAIWTQYNPAWDPARMAEERRRRGNQWGGLGGRSEVPTYSATIKDVEYEKFSEDVEWMPRTVLMAKSTYVWLAQLSRQYGRAIERLDQIPDEELDALARRGFNALWLIGLWERSRASKTIKQVMGNSDAVASAYSLYDYRVADDLGGEWAYNQLRQRASARGIRLASDMVANHMGIDSPWVVEHPDWFLSRWDLPYPNYSFEGPDLSADGRVEIQIERHYYDQSDAAVVFRRRDRSSGEVRYIYHGNDGTSFPWNDTAQLDYMKQEVREQVIQTILHVARMFPIIRFDAAMTLAKRHFHRLWFPGPGSSGAIPSRAEYGMTDEEFNRAMPQEFWREVVDRVAAEVPGTLLLAEAFWLMEGYFVRTLGMHRVYNSAFMNMLRDEENAKYRSVIKNTIEFDPDILKRYVNFMSNPDERTAIDQFGSGDKCFGVATVMATLPGLPMFGHGQIEGYTEKYGMEYRKPRYEENPNHALVERHERQIAPLLHRRSLFAESSEFLLYDFYNDDGSVNEDVFAYSNRRGDERALVIYHNKYAEAQGTIHVSVPYADKGSGQTRQRSLREGLGLSGDHDVFMRYRDAASGLEFLRRASELSERGFRIHLCAYECHAFLDWQPVRASAEQPWDRLCDALHGQGVPNLDEALLGLELRPAHDALRRVLEPGVVRHLADLVAHQAAGEGRPSAEIKAEQTAVLAEMWQHGQVFLAEAQAAYRSQLLKCGEKAPAKETAPAEMGARFLELFSAALNLPATEGMFPKPWPTAARRVLPSHSPEVMVSTLWSPVLGWAMVKLLAESVGGEGETDRALDLFDQVRLREPLAKTFAALGEDEQRGWRQAAMVRLALRPGTLEEPRVYGLSAALWSDPEVRWLVGCNEWQRHTYVSKEPTEELLWWMEVPAICSFTGKKAADRKTAAALEERVTGATHALAGDGYRVDRQLALSKVEEAAVASAPPKKAAGAKKSAKGGKAARAVEPSSKAEAVPAKKSAKTTPLPEKNAGEAAAKTAVKTVSKKAPKKSS